MFHCLLNVCGGFCATMAEILWPTNPQTFCYLALYTSLPHEEMFNIPGHKRNANQNHIKILPHSC
jgi:hypothetical protein